MSRARSKRPSWYSAAHAVSGWDEHRDRSLRSRLFMVNVTTL